MKFQWFAVLFLVCTTAYAQQWGNPENQMLSNTMTGFFYYATKDPVPFSDPNSLREANRHGTISDNYHDETERITENFRQQQLLQQRHMMQRYRGYRPYGYYGPVVPYNRGPGFMIPYP